MRTYEYNGLKAGFLQELCDNVISQDHSIRFAAIVDEDGKLLSTSHRKDLKPLLGPEERARVCNYSSLLVSIHGLDGSIYWVKSFMPALITLN